MRGAWSPTFWRSPSKVEVDFVVEIDGRRVGIEVKAAPRWRAEDGRYLEALHADGTFERIIGVYLGEQRRRSEGLEVLPLAAFVRLLKRDALLG